MTFIFPSLSRHIISSVSDNNLFTSYILFILRHLALTMHSHGNGKQQKAKTTTKIIPFCYYDESKRSKTYIVSWSVKEGT